MESETIVLSLPLGELMRERIIYFFSSSHPSFSSHQSHHKQIWHTFLDGCDRFFPSFLWKRKRKVSPIVSLFSFSWFSRMWLRIQREKQIDRLNYHLCGHNKVWENRMNDRLTEWERMDRKAEWMKWYSPCFRISACLSVCELYLFVLLTLLPWPQKSSNSLHPSRSI